MRILPITGLLYFFACTCMVRYASFRSQWYPQVLDRSNLGNARLQGLPQDILHGDASGKQFDWINSAFYFSYVRGENLDQSNFLTLFLSLDPMSSPCNDIIQTSPTSDLDSLYGVRMGSLINFNGSYLSPSLLPNLIFLIHQSTSFNFGSIIVPRILLGVFEAGFGPAIPVYLQVCMLYSLNRSQTFYSSDTSVFLHKR